MYLFLCTTPLQVRIAQYLRKKHDDSYLVYITEEAKFNTLSDFAKEKQIYYAFECDMWLKWGSTHDLNAMDFDFQHLDGIYYASFDNMLILNFVKQNKNVPCFSFDDGLADVYTKGIYTKELAEFLKNKTLKHYTLYSSKNHVISKDKLINLDVNEVFNFPTPSDCLTGKLTIMLGEEICVDPKLALTFNQAYLDTLDVDVYLPHPSSRFRIDSEKVESTWLILEDYLIERLKEYKEVEIYHFSSSASIHLKNIEGLSFIGIKIKPLNSLQKEMEEMGASFKVLPINYKL